MQGMQLDGFAQFLWLCLALLTVRGMLTLEHFKEQDIPYQVLAVGRVVLEAVIPSVGTHLVRKRQQRRHLVSLEWDQVRQDSIVVALALPKAVTSP